ncbi:hypothetical protein [Mycobacterium antarcticum]|uniref:hypothetical protein n=1 Tax=Mycolicibacterium sp. TUM20984 TaxID=3023368 RepID=UPI00238D9C44|nr:hypothetical protein [Mycolicibacterium sp. TUM20984]GLP80936.1 hypothetical protein TUM20984_23560 [Mycolicibacterium sp. TUM20984]
MKNLGLAGIIASGFAAAVLGLASPANADYGHNQWINDMSSSVSVPHVDTAAHR